MPEGDTIASAAKRIRKAVIGKPIEAVEPRHPRFAKDRWDERLAGRDVRAVDTHGKNLMLRFEGGLTVYSHLRMGGWWGVFRHGERWRRSPRRAWLLIRTADHEVVQFDGPILELMTDVDEGLQEWRYRHVKAVERTIGHKLGTGGSAGVDWLKKSLFQPLFPDLWAIRHRL